jgi:hypothetical protein
MALKDFFAQGPSMIGVFLMALAAIYLTVSVIIGMIRDRKGPASDRNYAPPSEQPVRKPW